MVLVTNTDGVPLRFNAWANAMQRMTWPVPISADASARMTTVTMQNPALSHVVRGTPHGHRIGPSLTPRVALSFFFVFGLFLLRFFPKPLGARRLGRQRTMEKHGVEEDPKCAARLTAPLGPEP